MRDTLLFFAVLTMLYAGFCLHNHQLVLAHAHEFKQLKNQYAATLNFEDNLLSLENVLDRENWYKAVDKADAFNQEALSEYEALKGQSLLFVYASLAYLILLVLVYVKSPTQLKAATLGVLIIGIAALVLGVTLPILEISAYKQDLSLDIPFFPLNFEGKMFFYYQNKSILDVVDILLKAENHVVAIAILLFSVVVPFIKLLLSILVLVIKSLSESKILNLIIQKIGKWSMADVFVAAAFLAYLSFQNMHTGIDTSSQTLVGLYFFFGYCMLSLVSSHMVELTLKK